jgi:transcriptional regulator with XRE-family HTH domain
MNQIKKINKNEGADWAQKVAYRRENKKWLGYSRKVALRILAAMEDIPNMNQKKLAESLNVSPQHISKITKGEENLTLKTIAAISEVLNTELILFPMFKYNQPLNVFFGVKSNLTFMIIPEKNSFIPNNYNYETIITLEEAGGYLNSFVQIEPNRPQISLRP